MFRSWLLRGLGNDSELPLAQQKSRKGARHLYSPSPGLMGEREGVWESTPLGKYF